MFAKAPQPRMGDYMSQNPRDKYILYQWNLRTFGTVGPRKSRFGKEYKSWDYWRAERKEKGSGTGESEKIGSQCNYQIISRIRQSGLFGLYCVHPAAQQLSRDEDSFHGEYFRRAVKKVFRMSVSNFSSFVRTENVNFHFAILIFNIVKLTQKLLLDC